MDKARLVAGYGLVLWNRIKISLGLAKPLDGWRRGAGVVLRGDESTFVLSSFGLRANEHVLHDRLSKLLEREPQYHLCIRTTPEEDFPLSHPSASFTYGIEQRKDGAARFIRPDGWSGVCQSPEAGSDNTKCLLNFMVRPHTHDVCDLWMRVNHVGLDGVLAQELLTKLEQELGKEEVLFPSHQQFQPFANSRSVEGRASAIELQTFVDLGPLMSWRSRQIAQLRENMTVSAAVLWWLAMHPSFRSLRMGTTVDLAASGNHGRGVGVVVVRPGDFTHKPNGVATFVRHFNRKLEQTRQRRSDAIKTLNAAAAIPAHLERLVLHKALESNRAFGSLGLSMLRDASVFGAPIAEVGHDHGFIAIGNVLLPTTDGGKVACVTVKGRRAL